MNKIRDPKLKEAMNQIDNCIDIANDIIEDKYKVDKRYSFNFIWAQEHTRKENSQPIEPALTACQKAKIFIWNTLTKIESRLDK